MKRKEKERENEEGATCLGPKNWAKKEGVLFIFMKANDDQVPLWSLTPFGKKKLLYFMFVQHQS